MRGLCAMMAVLLALCAAALAEPCCVVEGDIALLVDETGERLTARGLYDDFYVVRPGALYAAGRNGEYRLLDAQGAPVGEHTFDRILDAGEALVFRRGSVYGAMNDQGSVILEPVWTQLMPGAEGCWLALSGNAQDENPDPLIRILPDRSLEDTGVAILGSFRPMCGERMAVAMSDGLWGYVDSMGAMVIPAVWHAAGDFADGRAIVASADGMGVIDNGGVPVIPTIYRFITRVGQRFAALDADGVLTLLDADGVGEEWPDDRPVDIAAVGDALAVWSEYGASLLDAGGNRLRSVSGDARFAAGSNGQIIVSEGAWGEAGTWLMNPDGEALPGKYQALLALCPGRYANVSLQGAKYYSAALGEILMSWDYRSVRWGLVDDQGCQLLPARYREIRAVSDQRLLLITEHAVMLADRDGKVMRIWFPEQGNATADSAE